MHPLRPPSRRTRIARLRPALLRARSAPARSALVVCALLCCALLWCLTSCGGSPGDGGAGPAPVPPPPGPPAPINWGPLPPGPRLPGTPAPAGFRPEFTVQNRGGVRTETVRVSVPFPWTQVTDLSSWSVEGEATAWRVLQHWPDGSVRVAQAQFTTSLAADESRDYRVLDGAGSLAGPFEPHPVFAAAVPEFGAEVADTFGVRYRTFFGEPAETLQETALSRVRRFRGYHRAVADPGIGRDYLTSTFYLTEFRDQPLVLVDWLLGNDYLGADDPQGSGDPNLHPLGDIDLGRAAFLARGQDLLLPYRPQTEGIGTAQLAQGGYRELPVLQDTVLADGQTRRYRFLLLVDDPAVDPQQRAAARATASAMIETPLRPLATLASWQQTHALGLLGGPVTGPPDAAQRAEHDWQSWSGANHFGSWGSRGDPKVTGQTGTPRNQPLTPDLAHAVQSGDQRLLIALEQKAWIQAARPLHLYGLVVEDADRILLWDGVPVYPGSRDLSHESLGRRALRAADPYAAYRTRVVAGSQRAHGWQHFDHEHWTTDLVFDYWTATGDAWAHEELRQMGESLRGLLRPWGALTALVQPARAEGWLMQGVVQAWLATGDLRHRDFALGRLHVNLLPARPQHPSGAIDFDRNEVRTGFPLPHAYYMPWQHAAVLYGYLAAWKFFGDPLFLEVCDGVTRCVEYAWVRNYDDPVFGFVPNGIRYYVPVEYDGQPVPPGFFDASIGVQWGGSLLGGPSVMLVGGLLLLADTATDPATRERARFHGTKMEDVPYTPDELWDKWHYAIPEHWTR